MRVIINSPVLHAIFLFCVLSLFQQQEVYAHGVRVFAYTSGPDIIVEGRFSNGRATMNSKVKVFNDKNGQLILEGRTGKDGIFTFPRPKTAPDEGLKIVLNAGEGHQAHWSMTPEDLNEEPLPDEPATAVTGAADDKPVAAPITTSGESGKKNASRTGQAIDTRILSEVVARSVAREIAPLKKMMMEEMNRGPTMTEILGGIGWIIGIAGLLSAIAALKKK